jgi:hypothetical protein
MFSPLIQYGIERRPAAGGAKPRLPVVEAVGCLVQTSADRWTLSQAGKAVVSTAQSTSAAALRAVAHTAAGEQSYPLLGVDVFRPRRAGRHRVAVKGVLITDGDDQRLNVTSLQPVAGPCL